MSIPVNDLEKGSIFRDQGHLYLVLGYEHKNIARGKADIKVKVRDLETGTHQEVGFKSGQSVEEIPCHRENMDFVYFDERREQLVLSQPETQERFKLPADIIPEEKRQYLSEGSSLQVLIREDTGKIIDAEIPITVELKVKMTPPSDKGDTVSGGKKRATLNTGAVVQVPMFIEIGDTIKVNTEREEYMERVSDEG